MPNFYNQTVKESLDLLKTNLKTGLLSPEVKRRQKKYGKNVLDIKSTPLWKKILEPFIDVFMIILISAMILSAIQQDWAEVTIIAVIIVVDATIYYIQDFSTERVLRSLHAQTVHQITVLRDHEEIEIDADELVPGDIVIFKEGDRVPADGRIIEESGLLANESMLTGESDAIAKDAKAISGDKKVYEQRNILFSGSFILTGSGKMLVTATGNNTEYGQIASLASSAESSSPIQDKINKFVVRIAIVVVSLAILILIIQLANGISFFSAAEFTLAMIVSAVPEGLPVAISIILAFGARRMAKKRALIKEMRAIQSIGIVTTIASDKTGTLTENKLSLQEHWSAKNSDKNFLEVVAKSALPFAESTDPLDSAIWDYIKAHKSYLTDTGPVHSYAFDQSLKVSGNLYETKTGALNLVVKGAPETIFEKCKISEKNREEAEAKLEEFSNAGYKVIAVATAKLEHEINELNRLSKKDLFAFRGLIAIADSVRTEAIPAIKQATAAGIKVKMVTGDHAQTAFAIGKKLGLVNDFAQVFDCSRMGNIPDEDLEEIAKKTMVFARVTPEDKFRILTAIKKNEIVAMTGDGVNDVPALTNAHVGIAMGDGPAIVQDAGDIVLLDNNFKNIIEAMHEGRIILANIRRMLVYLLATNAGEVLTMVGALVFGGEQLLYPIQILWINLVTDSLMVIPIGLEPSEKHYLKRKPEPKDAPILSSYLIKRMIIIAITMAIITLGTYYISSQFLTHEQSNTLAFIALVVMQWTNAFTVRGIHESAISRLKAKNNSFLFSLAAAAILQSLAIFGPLGALLHVSTVPIIPLIIVVIISFIVPFVTVELHKKIKH
ncbi:cation-transporting P-type ATPase [Candidatus Saccharibacteria bacterium]|nr:cation-transporting P-type ATPase [Candidatus Saccharibacteria bacterium]